MPTTQQILVDIDPSSTDNAHGIHLTPFPSRTQTVYHPSDAINACLLQQTHCDIAVCHDDSWRFFFKSCSSRRTGEDVLNLEDSSKPTGDSGHRAIGIQNEVAFLLPDSCQGEQIPSHATDVSENPTDSPRLRPKDIVVLVMGIVGAGRSTFINNLLPAKHKDRKLLVGHGLDSCTTTTKCVVLESQDLTEVLGVEKDYRLVLVDTPGLDWSAESKLDPEAVREDIVKWSNSWLPVGQKPRGCVIFMRDITSDGFRSEHVLTSLSNLFTPPSNSPRLIIVTSKWDISKSDEAEARHKHLREQFQQAEVHRLSRPEDAWKIMTHLLPKIEKDLVLNLEGENGDPHLKKSTLGGALRSLVCVGDSRLM
ncbi:hypothetical protein FA13DRAFT_304897 [Coprinellus micaceus]|uniref:Uncharacterized protein n=1 Tax=Coprinellus micaceus TaxID=71717 RepID=A0A4Y7SDS9_COPMI|nr:hypothetical protein FA13DRAFT_304897 [Coprinellus micaceus]